MNSKKVGGKSSFATAGGVGTAFKKSNFEASGSVSCYPKHEQLSSEMGDLTIDPIQNGEWEVIGKKKNKVGSMAGKQWSSNSAPKAWVQPGTGRSSSTGGANSGDSRLAVGRWNPKQQSGTRNCETANMTPNPSNIPPPLQHGWNWGARGGSAVNLQKNENISTSSVVDPTNNQPEGVSDDDDYDTLVDGSDEEFSDDYDSDASQRSHETRKRNKWLKGFFENLDKLSVDEMGEQTRQWHCPACHNGPGAIDWYDGLQPLMTHAKTKRSTRPRLHRELALLLDEELRRRGTSVIPAGEAFGKWKGLRESTTDREIVWPPMVIVMNTKLEKDENDKWIGMGNQELLEYFGSYAAKRARHSYGPHGHRGISVLIFDSSEMGYMEAERLHRHFVEQGTSREAWERSNPVLFCHGGKRQLYGYLARKEDLDIFNQHSQGKSRLKFDVRSYQEMVVIPMKQMSEDNQQLTYLKNKVVKEKEISKALHDNFVAVTQKLRETSEDNQIVRLRTKMQQDESKEMMDYQERFFKDQIDRIHKHTEEKERRYEKLLQEERAKAKYTDSNYEYGGDRILSKKIEKFIESQTKDVEAFESRREKLIKAHDEKKISLRRRHLAEEVELEKEFDAELTQLMEEYAPNSFNNSGSD
ncbi:protein SUPPRESSOR OF GENE SILENCING 3 homolog [Dendrobium catenatum]|uniref:protein SUPPRESSOR OF GENE SILENCING 3 homolog n=2 Tax=Dendrobium catenatum TaxID=906689 RepID=UPI00109EE59C|nr:protein SUPPRESSOR OF GENE SILENCING 3 homolog [Dendrobium catenatum]